MHIVILVLKFIIWTYLILGLIKPSLVLSVINPNRWKIVGIWFIGIFLVSLVQESYWAQIETGEIEDTRLKKYVSDEIEVLLPTFLKERNDTIYSETGELRALSKTVGGQIKDRRKEFGYSLSITNYLKEEDVLPTDNLDSIRSLLAENIKQSTNFDLINIHQTFIQGKNAIEYLGKNSDKFTKAVLLRRNKKIIAVTYLGPDSTNLKFEEIILSIKIK